MHRVNVSLYAAALTVIISGLWWGPYALSAKERSGSSGIPPEKAAAYIYAVIKADRCTRRRSSIDSRRKASLPRPNIGNRRTPSCCRPSFSNILESSRPRTEAGSGID